jgi:hypothetical protein
MGVGALKIAHLFYIVKMAWKNVEKSDSSIDQLPFYVYTWGIVINHYLFRRLDDA